MHRLRVIIFLLLLTSFPYTNAKEIDVISPRVGSRMVVDTENNQVILFGGYTVEDSSNYFDDTWIFSPIDYPWTHLLIDGPSPRGAHSMAYNPEDGVILLFGGQSSYGRLGDTWQFNCDSETWSEIETDIAPEGRGDSARAQCLLQ